MIHPFLVVLVSISAQTDAQRPGAQGFGKPQGRTDWTTEWRARTELKYNSNVFLLSGTQEDRMNANVAGDQVSGRFDDMESVDDLILTPDLRFEAKGPSPLGGRWDLRAGVEYALYLENTRRSHLLAGLGVGQKIGPAGRLELSFGFLPQYFNKNYLADATDLTGDVAADERRYREGVYREWEVEVEYRHAFWNRSAPQPFGMDGILAAGFRDRTYDSPFGGRDEEAPYFKLGLEFEHGKGVAWGLLYRLEDVDSPTRREVLLLDEFAFGTPLNGDGLVDENDARTVQSVDRSRREQSVSLFVSVDLSPTAALRVGYTRLLKSFDSGEPFDVSHRDREDARDEIEAVLKFDMAKGWYGRAGLEWREQETDRPTDPGSSGETTDYKRWVFFFSAVYRF